MMNPIGKYGRAFWQALRRLSGDDAYERYLRHHAQHQVSEPPLSREEFYKQWQERKWKGVKRCC
ncbi:MAG: YbdD/YjiX family protein [Methylophilaceae bacterium]|nr:YbdD/YjiX family protein [Methylophilaceae bacterium]